MANEDIIRIKVGSFQVGIVGLQEVLAELGPAMAKVSDDALGEALLQKLSKKNYIPPKARSDYSRALVREFRKYLGQDSPPDQEKQELVIRVLGQGCDQCRTLSKRVLEVLSELNLAADFEHITDIKEIARYGVLQSPALLINNRITAVGRVPSKSQLMGWIKE